MKIINHDGDLVREAVNRSEYHRHEAVGEVGGEDVLVSAFVNDRGFPVLNVYTGGRLETNPIEYVGGESVTERFDWVWELDTSFGEYFREYDLEMLESNDA